MSSSAEMAERHGRMLAELGELGLTLARDLQGRALAAETSAEAAQLAEAFHRLSRSVRQSLALEAKLQRDAQRDAREVRDAAARETEARRAARKAQLKRRVERLIWDQIEEPEFAAELAGAAPHMVEREAESESFLDEPVEAQIERIRAALGVDEPWELDEAETASEGDDPSADEDADAAAAAPADPPPKPPPWPSPYDDRYNSA
jgi:hypothetical protein